MLIKVGSESSDLKRMNSLILVLDVFAGGPLATKGPTSTSAFFPTLKAVVQLGKF